MVVCRWYVQYFPRADIGSDHDLLMMTFNLRLKGISKPNHTRLKFDLEKMKDPNVLETFQAMIGEKFAPLNIMYNEDADMDSMTTTFNTAVTETASEILGKHRQKKRLRTTNTFVKDLIKKKLMAKVRRRTRNVPAQWLSQVDCRINALASLPR